MFSIRALNWEWKINDFPTYNSIKELVHENCLENDGNSIVLTEDHDLAAVQWIATWRSRFNSKKNILLFDLVNLPIINCQFLIDELSFFCIFNEEILADWVFLKSCLYEHNTLYYYEIDRLLNPVNANIYENAQLVPIFDDLNGKIIKILNTSNNLVSDCSIKYSYNQILTMIGGEYQLKNGTNEWLIQQENIKLSLVLNENGDDVEKIIIYKDRKICLLKLDNDEMIFRDNDHTTILIENITIKPIFSGYNSIKNENTSNGAIYTDNLLIEFYKQSESLIIYSRADYKILTRIDTFERDIKKSYYTNLYKIGNKIRIIIVYFEYISIYDIGH